ncbi:MAG: helix-turn-helix domain-containing protein [Oscillospiraceae bacterium]|nr:helix-turn-helix domain-containing protein [Oscillospiraceae bacterium]
MQQKIKQDINIGANIRDLRLRCDIGQTEMAIKLQLLGIDMTRVALYKIESGEQHIQATQLRGIRDVLGVTYDDLLKEQEGMQ